MAPAADLDERLIHLQVQVAQARIEHENLVERRDLMKRMHYHASAQALDAKVSRAYDKFYKASCALASYISNRQRNLRR